MFTKLVLFLFLSVLFYEAKAKVYERCDFARTILKYGLKKEDLGTWSCIAKHESNYDTTAINHDTGDYGIFQISHYFWCSDSNQPGKACKITCKSLLSDNINIDVECVKKIKKEQGFKAWVTYPKYCAGNNDNYIKGCFDNPEL